MIEIKDVLNVYAAAHNTVPAASPDPVFKVLDPVKVAIDGAMIGVRLSLVNMVSGIFEGVVFDSQDPRYPHGAMVWFRLPP